MNRTANPAKPDEIYTASITGMDHEGRGVARVDGKVVFIDGALPGELVQFRYRRRRKRYDGAEVVNVLEPSPFRVEPPCEYFGVCGGCSWQHLAPEQQIIEKENILRDNFKHLAKLEAAEWLTPLTGPIWHYRRKARLGARLVPKKGGVLVGFREKRSSFITDLGYCRILDKRVSDVLPALRDLIETLSCPDRIPQVEVAGGDAVMALSLRHLEPLSEHDRKRIIGFGQEHQLQMYVQPKGPESIECLYPDEEQPLAYHLAEQDLTIQFRVTDFTQVNTELNQKMVTRALELLELDSRDKVLDLFCGLGNFSLPLAQRVNNVLGIEGDKILVEGAEANASRNDINNARFISADLYHEHESPPWQGFEFNKLLIDPPRSGAMEVIKQLPEQGVERIVYVSCNPATLARDAEFLVHERQYVLTRAGVMDMFPHTSHVESIAVFEKHE